MALVCVYIHVLFYMCAYDPECVNFVKSYMGSYGQGLAGSRIFNPGIPVRVFSESWDPEISLKL